VPRVAIVGIGRTALRPLSSEISYKEMMFEAAVGAYEDAGVEPRKDIGSFVGVSEDFWEGTSIFDEYLPDQLGGALRPVCTIGNEGLHGIATAAMQIMTGQVKVAAVESHSKLSEVDKPQKVMQMAFDPILNRPLDFNPHVVAGLEMARFLGGSVSLRNDCARVVAQNRASGLKNPYAAYPAQMRAEDVLGSADAFSPLKELEMSGPADGAVVVVLASEEKAKGLRGDPVWIDGMGWANDTPTLEARDWSTARYAKLAMAQASKMAGYGTKKADLFEIDDTYAYKEIQHAAALGICKAQDFRKFVDGNGPPINPSGGSLGCGHILDATGLFKLAEAVEQLRGTAGKRQVKGAKRALVQSWRGVPTTSGAVVLLSNNEAGPAAAGRGAVA
jgi:acetyl-CoA C-acetyltransferase